MPRLDLGDFRLHYQQAGDGPDVVLIHAFTSNLAVWMLSGLIDELASEFRVTAYDLRGHGLSDVTPHGYTSREMAADFRRLKEGLGLGPAYLVGHSYGGVIATHVAVEDPEAVRGVVIADTYFPGLAEVEENVADTAVWRELRSDFAAAGIELDVQVDFAGLFEAVRDLTPEQSERLEERLGPAGVRWLAPLGRLAGTTAGTEMFEVAGLTAERIAGLDLPLVGLYDEETTFGATARFLAERLPNAEIDVVPGARHLAPLQNPTDFNRLVRQHLQAMAAAAPTVPAPQPGDA